MDSTNGSVKHTRRLQRLRCSVQNYDWGRIGPESGVARLFSRNSGLEIEQDKPYAELWMGTHASGPSFLIESLEDVELNGSESGKNVTLKYWIEQNPDVLGDKVVDKWNTDLPFLFKVLSVAKSLSIQAHPDKQLAEILHKARPNDYKDENHKPEMVLAVTEFEALCGFINLEELKGVLQDVPEISEVVGCAYADQVLNVTEKDGEEKQKAVLQSIFTQLMSASKEVISEVLPKLISRLNLENKLKWLKPPMAVYEVAECTKCNQSVSLVQITGTSSPKKIKQLAQCRYVLMARQLTSKEELVLRLEKQYSDDIGVIAALLFNYVKLNPGEALYLGANEPHAYIYGECIECMATSDNVVRAGLTPKKRDVEILCSMLTYKQGFPEILLGVPINPNTRRYTPPLDEFEVDHCVLHLGASVLFPAIPGPSIFLVAAGDGTMHSAAEYIVSEGDVLFAPASTEISVTAASELHLYRAGVNSRIF